MPHRIIDPLELPPIALAQPSCQWLVENGLAKVHDKGLFANFPMGPRIAEVPAELRRLGLGATAIGQADPSSGFYLQALPVVSEPQRQLELTWVMQGTTTRKLYFIRDGFVASGARVDDGLRLSPGFSASLLCSVLTREFGSPKPWTLKIRSDQRQVLMDILTNRGPIGSPSPTEIKAPLPAELLTELQRNRFVIRNGPALHFAPGAQKVLEPIFSKSSLRAKVAKFSEPIQEREFSLVGTSGRRLWVEERPIAAEEAQLITYRALSLPQAAEISGFMVGL